MKAIKYIVALCVITASVGCKGLKREDYTQIYEEDFFQTETDLKLAVNGLYNPFGCGYGYGSMFNPGMPGYQQASDMTTDLAWCSWGADWDELHFMQWNATTSSLSAPGINAIFARYSNLSTERNTILKIKKSPVQEDIRNKYEAEARGVRGWMALHIYDFLGTVPVASDEVLANPQEKVYLPRATEEEWQTMMEEDLNFAIKYLPETQADRGRLTKGAARMILLKYYMIKKDFVKAEAIARDLLAQRGTYTILPVYKDVFSKEQIGNKEIILQIPTNNPKMPNIVMAHILPDNMPWTERSSTWGAYVMPWDFYDTFDANDKRREQCVAEYTAKDGSLEIRGKGKLTLGAIPLKYGKDLDMSGDVCGIDIVVYRFSDVLLSVAELATRNNNNVSTESINLVNEVRTRAGLGDLTAAQTASPDAFLAAILTERGHEFWYEGLRRQDLIRFDKYVEYGNARVKRANAGLYPGKTGTPNYNAVPDYYTKFWIPRNYIVESKDLVKQNPGYVN